MSQQERPQPFSGRIPLFKRFPSLRWRPQASAEIIEPQNHADHPAFTGDFKVLEDNLMGEFRRLDTEALRGQNQFHLEQVTLILGGALVTALGAIQVTLAALLHNSLAPGLAEAVIAAVLAGVAQYARSSKSQERYFSSRLKAEALRGEYFRFLGRIGDHYANEQRRVVHLQQRVVAITTSNDRQKSTFISVEPPDEAQEGISSLSEQEQPFWALYQRYRHQHQLDFYRSRQEEFDKAQSQATILTIALMTLAAVVSLLGSANLFNFSTGWGVLAVIFPVLATALSTYESVYAFERQAKLYNDAAIAMRYVQAFLSPQANASVSLREYVEQVETILAAEQGQWGQLVSQINVATAPGAGADQAGAKT